MDLQTFINKLTMKTAESLRTYSCITCSVIVSHGSSINDVELQRALIFDAISLQFIYFEKSPIIGKKRTHFGFGCFCQPCFIDHFRVKKIGGNSKFGDFLKTLWPSQLKTYELYYMGFYLPFDALKIKVNTVVYYYCLVWLLMYQTLLWCLLDNLHLPIWDNVVYGRPLT